MQKHERNRFVQFALPFALLLAVIALSLQFATPSTASSGNHNRRDWPVYSYDLANTNHNPTERKISAENAQNLRRAWETFNDDALVPEPPPTGFVLEGALGLVYRSSVVGVVASPIIQDRTIYYIDQLGTVFARDAKTGQILNPNRHWTTTLVDPDFDAGTPAVLPELIFTAPVVTDSYVWIAGSAFGRLHAVSRWGGQEIDFDPSTPEIDPYSLITDLPFSSVLGDSVIIEDDLGRTLFIAGINIILNDALVQGAEGGLQIAIDISDPFNPVEAWRTYTIDIDPATNARYSTGVSAGAGLAVDTERGWIFGGTGQNTSLPYPEYPDLRPLALSTAATPFMRLITPQAILSGQTNSIMGTYSTSIHRSRQAPITPMAPAMPMCFHHPFSTRLTGKILSASVAKAVCIAQ